jgi:hypothetical protein
MTWVLSKTIFYQNTTRTRPHSFSSVISPVLLSAEFWWEFCFLMNSMSLDVVFDTDSEYQMHLTQKPFLSVLDRKYRPIFGLSCPDWRISMIWIFPSCFLLFLRPYSETAWKIASIHIYHSFSGATRIYWSMGKLRLCQKKTVGEMGKVFIDGPNKILITYRNQKNKMMSF